MQIPQINDDKILPASEDLLVLKMEPVAIP